MLAPRPATTAVRICHSRAALADGIDAVTSRTRFHPAIANARASRRSLSSSAVGAAAGKHGLDLFLQAPTSDADDLEVGMRRHSPSPW
jgi:hypothetical protein